MNFEGLHKFDTKGANLAIARLYKRCEIKVLYIPYFFDRQTPLVLTKKC